MIEILHCNVLNSVQDLGRFGHRGIGISTSGVMDQVSLRIGNIMVGNPETAAGIEIQTFPFEIRFRRDMRFALTGAVAPASLSGIKIPPFWTAVARSGDTLVIKAPVKGARVYLAFSGGIDVPPVLGSRSTHLRAGFGGYCGRHLRTGDILTIGPAQQELDGEFGVVAPVGGRLPGAVDPAQIHVRAIRASEYDCFAPEERNRFWESEWHIHAQSDRGGYRLGGGSIRLEKPMEMRSYGVVAGIVQITPSGQPIIQLSDANTAGGYPRFAGIIDADLWKLGQASLGAAVRFHEVDFNEAQEASRELNAKIANIRTAVDNVRVGGQKLEPNNEDRH